MSIASGRPIDLSPGKARPWIWIVLLLALLMGASVAALVIAHVNRPEIVKPRD